MPGVVHRHDGARPRRDGGLDGGGIEAERVGVDVAEDRPGARAHDHVGGRGPGQRRRDDLVALALADAERAQREVHRGGAGRDGERDGRLGVERELALQLARERPGRQPAGLERVQHVRALLVAQRGRREVEAMLAAHRRAAGDGGEIERDGHEAQDTGSLDEPIQATTAGSRKTISLRLHVTTATSRPNAMGAAKAAPSRCALRDQPARGRRVHAQAPRARDDDHRVVGDRRHGAELAAETLRPGSPEPALLGHGERVQPGRLAGIALRGREEELLRLRIPGGRAVERRREREREPLHRPGCELGALPQVDRAVLALGRHERAAAVRLEHDRRRAEAEVALGAACRARGSSGAGRATS